MTEFLHIRDWFKIKRGDYVRVKTFGRYPIIDGVHQITRVLKTSNFPYRIMLDNHEQLLGKDDVRKLKGEHL